MKRIIIFLITLCLVLCCFASCGKGNSDDKDTPDKYFSFTSDSDAETEGAYFDTDTTGAGVSVDMSKVKSQINGYKYADFVRTDDTTDFAVVRVKGYGDIVLALRSDIAPATVENFKSLVEKEFYNNLIFHRVAKDFMIQGGGMYADGREKDSDTIIGEFQTNGYSNNLQHEAGVISMARTQVKDSASSQFFIMHTNIYRSSLDGQYAAFGYVLAGMDVVNAIAECEVDDPSSMSPKPVDDVIIKEVFFVKPINGTKIGAVTKYAPCTHTYGDWETSKEASCTSLGEEKRICADCGNVETREVEKLPHEYSEGFCIVCKDYNFEGSFEAEGTAFNTAATGSGADIDMAKVKAQIGAYKYSDFVKSDEVTDFIVFRVKDYGNIVVALRGDVAVKTVENIKKLVSSGYYNDMIFHRVKKDFMIQGGGITAEGSGKVTDKVVGEFEVNGHTNNLKHITGVISMARASDYDSASSQFFIMHADKPHLDGEYAAFGYVLAGADVVDKIANCEVYNASSSSPSPVEDVVIEDVFFVSPVKGTELSVSE